MPDFWSSLDIISMIFLSFAVFALVGLILSIFVEYLRDMVFSLTFALLFCCLVGGMSGIGDMRAKQLNNYNDAVSELTNNLANDGFKIVSGTPDLHPNAQSSMLLSYDGKNFDCTMFSPKDSNTSVVFSCGEAKLTLSEVKNNVSK